MVIKGSHRRLLAGALIAILLALSAAGCGSDTERYQTELQNADIHDTDYGVFLSITENLESLGDYRSVVIDAQYFSREEIDAFRAGGHKVYSYINVGSIEDFRDYYSEYEDLALGEYEHWEEESWIDVSDSRWQDFITGELAPSLLAKDIDGFFVDNCDVYFQYPEKEILEGLTVIMRSLVRSGKEVLINGGDAYLNAYCSSGGSWSDVITGINQESVFSRILWDGDRFGTATEEDREYFQEYIEEYGQQGADIYLLEYTRDRRLMDRIRKYCQQKGFGYYIADSLLLD